MNARQAAISQGLLFFLMCFIVGAVCVVGTGIWFELRRGNEVAIEQNRLLERGVSLMEKLNARK